MSQRILIANPLPAALAHYVAAIQATGDRLGHVFEDIGAHPVEGRKGRTGQAAMLANVVRNEIAVRKSTDPVLTAWPSAGLIDAGLAVHGRSSRIVVIHDPVPLRRQVGYGARAGAWADSQAGSRRPLLLTHSPEAEMQVRKLLPHHDVVTALLPLLSAGSPPRAHSASFEPVVLVAGQYKPARDLEVLERIGPVLRRKGFLPRIVGRGWPDVQGWEVDSRFVPEDELDSLLASAAVFFLPYSHYFQSEVSLRALENGTLTVGKRTGFLDGLLGRDAPTVVDGDETQAYVAAIDRAIELDARSRSDLLTAARTRADATWAEALERFQR